MRGHDGRDDGRREQAAKARHGARQAHAAGAQVGRVDLGREGVQRAPGAQQREAHQQRRADHQEARRAKAVQHASHRAQDQEADQRGLAAPAFHPVGRQREARQLHQRQQHQEFLAAHEGEALAAQLDRQVDEDAVVGDRDQRPGQAQRDAAAAQHAREQRRQRLALMQFRLELGDVGRPAVDARHALEHLARLHRLAVAIQIHRRLGNVEAQHHADQRRQAGDEEDHAPGIIAPRQRGQRQQRQADRAQGIAMGLIKNPGEDKYAVLSDILGDEDHLGDMDFKVTGTKNGITATQMDIKVDGLSFDILERALNQAKEGRMHILGKILETIQEPREELKPHAPRIETMTIPKEFIGAIIGPGGKIIQGMQEETGATITIEEVDNIGRIEISGTNKKSIDDAMRLIKGIVAVPEVGEVYKGKVRSVMPYGAFVEFLPGKDGLLHISEIDWKRLETVEEAGIKEGDEIEVKLLDIDPKTGKFKLSRKVLLPRPERQERPEKK